MKELRHRFPFVEEGLLMSKLIAYCSKEAHSSVEKAAMIAMIKLRILETDSSFRLRGDTLQTAISVTIFKFFCRIGHFIATLKLKNRGRFGATFKLVEPFILKNKSERERYK
jgi:hypothetical protein